VAWQAKHIQTASLGFIVRTGSAELNNNLTVVLAFTKDSFSPVSFFSWNELL